MPRFCGIGKRIYPGFAAGGPEQSLQIQPGGGTPQGGFSRPSADSPSAPALRYSSDDACPLDCPLIRLAFGRASLPPLAFGHFPLTGGIGLPPKGKAYGRVRTPAPTKYGNRPGLSVGAGPRPARQDSYRERWLGKPRRRI